MDEGAVAAMSVREGTGVVLELAAAWPLVAVAILAVAVLFVVWFLRRALPVAAALGGVVFLVVAVAFACHEGVRVDGFASSCAALDRYLPLPYHFFDPLWRRAGGEESQREEKEAG